MTKREIEKKEFETMLKALQECVSPDVANKYAYTAGVYSTMLGMLFSKASKENRRMVREVLQDVINLNLERSK